jgi:hypothetical protein
VVALKAGAAGQIDTASASAPVVGAVLTNNGLLAQRDQGEQAQFCEREADMPALAPAGWGG